MCKDLWLIARENLIEQLTEELGREPDDFEIDEQMETAYADYVSGIADSYGDR